MNCPNSPITYPLLESYVKDWFTAPITLADSIYGKRHESTIFDSCFGHNKFGPDTNFSFNKACIINLWFKPWPKEGTGYLRLGILDSFTYTQPNCYSETPTCSKSYQHFANYQKSHHSGRSFAEVKISSPLNASDEYVIEFYCLKGNMDGNNIALKSIGALVTQDTFRHFDYKKNKITPTVQNNQYLFEYKDWVRVKGSFVATGNEQFFTLGNFLTDKNSDFQFTPSDTNNCNKILPYNFIDAVYLYLHTDTLFKVSLPPDTTLCLGEDLELYAMHDDGFKLEDSVKTFLWSTGSTDSSITVNKPGMYWVKVEYNHRFWDSDTMYIDPLTAPYTSGLNPYKEGCQGDAIELNAQPDITRSLVWNTGIKGTSITARDSGYYWLTAISLCDTVIDSVLVNLINCDTLVPPLPVYIPSAFTPNGDGLNDSWRIGNLPEENQVIITNRWGEVMLNQMNYQNNWKGTNSSGNKLPLGVYVYQVIYTEYPGIRHVKKGWVTILE